MAGITRQWTEADVAAEFNKLLKETKQMETENDQAIFALRIGHAKELYEERKRFLNREKVEQENLEHKTRSQIQKIQLTALEDLKKRKDDLSDEEYKEEVKKIKAKYKFDGDEYKALLKRNAKEKERDDKRKEVQAIQNVRAELAKRQKEELTGLKKFNLKKRSELRNQVIDEQAQELADRGMFGGSKEKAAQAIKRDLAIDTLHKTVSVLSDFAKSLSSDIEATGNVQKQIDTRLQGSSNKKLAGSVWRQMEWDIGTKVGVSPFLRQSDLVENLKTMVGKGISFDVEQRAFLQTISDKIANTFDATDATLMKLVRIQQADTTAARLGMESALTAFLNNMYETTEYMTDAAESVRQNLYEASALMSATNATEFEYQVQKWVGSLYSVGFSRASELSGSLGKLAAGDISGITEGGTGNLLIMAANRAGVSITDALQDGLDASETNKLMEAVVDYLAKIYNDSQGSKVIQQQFAKVYGLSASDLKAAANLASSTSHIARNDLDYGGMIGQLQNMASTMWQRTSTGEMLNNAWANFKYSLAGSIGANPALYAIWGMSNLLDEVANGIEFGIPTVMGNGMASQTFRVSDIMKAASITTAALPAMYKALAGLGSLNTNTMLKRFGVDGGLTTATRGTGEGLLTIERETVSQSNTYQMNEEGGSDAQNKAMTDTKDSAKNETAEAVDDSNEIKLKDVNENVVAIYQLLNDVSTGTKKLHVDVDGEFAWTGTIGGNPGTGTLMG